MRKWAEIAITCAKDRYNLLSQILNEDCSIENEVDFLEVSRDDFAEALEEATQKYDLLRIGAGLGELVVQHYPFSSERINILQTADVLLPIGDKWWTRSATFHGLQKCVSENGGGVDTELKVLIAGAGAISRAIIATFIKMGFKSFNVTNHQEEPVHTLINDLKKYYFGIEFNYVPMDQLILLTGNHSVVANSTPFMKENTLLNELYYFNYLAKNGLVIDFDLRQRETPYIQEARAINARTIQGFDIASWADTQWVKWSFNYELNREDYHTRLEAVIPACESILKAEKEAQDSIDKKNQSKSYPNLKKSLS